MSDSLYPEHPRTCLTLITDFNDIVLEIMRFTIALYLAVFGLATLGSSMPVAGGPTPAVVKRNAEALPEPFPDPLPEP